MESTPPFLQFFPIIQWDQNFKGQSFLTTERTFLQEEGLWKNWPTEPLPQNWKGRPSSRKN